MFTQNYLIRALPCPRLLFCNSEKRKGKHIPKNMFSPFGCYRVLRFCIDCLLRLEPDVVDVQSRNVNRPVGRIEAETPFATRRNVIGQAAKFG